MPRRVRPLLPAACGPLALGPLVLGQLVLGPLVLGLLLLCQPAGADWRAQWPVEQAPRLQGEGEVRYWGFSLYRARLWAPPQGYDSSQPYALELVYARAIGRERIVSVSMEEITRIYGDLPPAQAEQWRARLAATLVDVHEGDRLIGLYLPGQGLRFYFAPVADPGPSDERLLGQIDDEALARAFFGIWLDPQTRAPQLRARLLGTLTGAGAR